MDRGMFPIYYLHLERDTGKKVFLLAGKFAITRTNLLNNSHPYDNHMGMQVESVRRAKRLTTL